MTTLVIEDASRELQAQIAAAKAKRAALGIQPIEHRPIRVGPRAAVLVDPSVTVADLARALRAGGFELLNAGGNPVIRPARTRT